MDNFPQAHTFVAGKKRLLMMFSEEGKEYEFRVFAENEVGESEPLQTARSVIAKNQYCEYQEFSPPMI